VTNKSESAKTVELFHNGRGSQEAIFCDAKNDTALDVIPSKRQAGIQIFTLCAMMAHNLSCELKMLAAPSASKALPKRPAACAFGNRRKIRSKIRPNLGRDYYQGPCGLQV